MCFQTKWDGILKRVRRDGHQFNLTKDYLLGLLENQQWQCTLTGRKIGFNNAPDGTDTASPDRIDSNNGYVVGNMQWLHVEINYMKNKLDQEHFVHTCREITQWSLDKQKAAYDITNIEQHRMVPDVLDYNSNPVNFNQLIPWLFPQGDDIPAMDEMMFRKVLEWSQTMKLSLWLMITPQLAQTMLDLNESNRKRGDGAINILRDSMQKWKTNGETVIFSREGLLNDGQGRLGGCIKSGRSFKTLVAFGVERESRNTVDTGQKRSNADVLVMNGVTGHAACLARAIAVVAQHDEKNIIDPSVAGGAKYRVDSQEQLEILDRHPNLLDEKYHQMARSLRSKLQTPEGLMCGVYYVVAEKQVAQGAVARVDQFFEKLRDGTNLEATDPIYRLRESLTREWKKEGDRRQKHTAAMTIKAWNFHILGGTSSRMGWMDKKEKFPQIQAPAILS